jgi:hypothetical protein
MNVLIACEESQRVCVAFRNKGHIAFSCDMQEPSGDHPEWHIQCDVLEIINPNCTLFPICEAEPEVRGIQFKTMDGKDHVIHGRWDLIIAHPPCTYLSNAGACRLYTRRGVLNKKRYEKGLQAKQFFMQIMNADCDRIAIENPIPSTVFGMPEYTQIIQPYEYGHPYSKKTCLWLKGLPMLRPTNILTQYKPYVSCGTSMNKGNPEKKGVSRAGGASKVRSKTFQGIAEAMADQWSDMTYHDYKPMNLF